MILLKFTHRFWLVLLVLSLCEKTLQKSFEQQEPNLSPVSVEHVNLVKNKGEVDDDGLQEILETEDSKNTEDIQLASTDSHYRVTRQATGSWQPTSMQVVPNYTGQHFNSAQYPATHQLSYPSSDNHQPDFTKQFPMNNPGYSLYNNNQYGQSLPHLNSNIQPGQTPQYPSGYPNHGYNQYSNNIQPGQPSQYPGNLGISGHSQYPINYNQTSQPQNFPHSPNYPQYSNNTQHGATPGSPNYPNVYPKPSYPQYSNNTQPGQTPQYHANGLPGYNQYPNYNLTGQTPHYHNSYPNPNYQHSNHGPVPIPHNRPIPQYHNNMTGPSPHSYPSPGQQSQYPNNYPQGYPQNYRFNQTSNGYPVLNPSNTNPGYTPQYPSAPQYPTNTKTGQTPQYYNNQLTGHQYPYNNQLGQSTQYPGYQTHHY